MDTHHLISPDGKFLGYSWSALEVVGWLGNAVFFSRFVVQWHATERRKQVVVPPLFWWLSLTGSLLLLCYAILAKKGPVIVFAYAFTWIPYIRNLIIHHRHENSRRACSECGALSPGSANYCSQCGTKLIQSPVSQPQQGGI
jgi:lipid-A-disaccharide synthase-like uncharacterized protein